MFKRDDQEPLVCQKLIKKIEIDANFFVRLLIYELKIDKETIRDN